jgi:hypothetical protein
MVPPTWRSSKVPFQTFEFTVEKHGKRRTQT